MIISLLALVGIMTLVAVSVFECFRIVEQFEIINKNLEAAENSKKFKTINCIDYDHLGE